MNIKLYTMPYSLLSKQKTNLVKKFCEENNIGLEIVDIALYNIKDLIELKLHGIPCVRNEEGKELIDKLITTENLHTLCATDIEENK